MADDKLPWRRSESIEAIRPDRVDCRAIAISLRLFQNGSSRLTLVLWPATMTERLTIADFIARPRFYLVVLEHALFRPNLSSSIPGIENVTEDTDLSCADRATWVRWHVQNLG
jgi:hypothetical protein